MLTPLRPLKGPPSPPAGTMLCIRKHDLILSGPEVKGKNEAERANPGARRPYPLHDILNAGMNIILKSMPPPGRVFGSAVWAEEAAWGSRFEIGAQGEKRFNLALFTHCLRK
ncbi:hypothetical protein MHYP_G00292900 [Metynnis hypsauchen]